MRISPLPVFLLVFCIAGCATATRGKDSKQDLEQEKFKYEVGSYKNTMPQQIEYEEDYYKPTPLTKTSQAVTNDATAKNIQKALKKAGFYSGPIDGKIGNITKKSIKDFQKANDLNADGVVGKNTWAKLKKYL